MFIKFGDKTKKIIVKTSKKNNKSVEDQDENAIYLDSEDKKNRRVHILNEYDKPSADDEDS
jgi:hypothetical protein